MQKPAIIVGAALAIVVGTYLSSTGPNETVESSATSTTTPDSLVSTSDSIATSSTTTAPASDLTTASPPSTIGATIADDGDVAAPTLTMDVEVAQLGDTFIRFRFRSSEPTPYTTTVSDQQGNVVGSTDGVLAAGEILTERVEGLAPGTVYSAQAFLIGPPAIESSQVLFRTTGAIEDVQADAQTAPVVMSNLRIAELGSTHFQFDYLSNVCANGSFRIVEQATGVEVGLNNGHPNGCVDKHLGVPGRWTPPLEPETTYVVTVTLEANGELRGRPYGNVVTESLVVTTAPREVPENPSGREVADVEFVSIEQMETTDTSVRIDFATNVCTNAAFVVREVGGDEVGRHDGFPRGCATEHAAIPGVWTPLLEPDTTYTVFITAEADGAGSGDGNLATESITVRTESTPNQSANPPPAVEFASIVADDSGSATELVVETNVCATVTVLAYEQAGDVLGEPIATAACAQTTELAGIPLAPSGNTVVVVTAEADETTPGVPNRASEIVIIAE